jgi:hypothetical protein
MKVLSDDIVLGDVSGILGRIVSENPADVKF